MTKTVVAALIAARAIAIEGKHFAQGEEISGVDAKEVETCVRLGSVVDAASEEGKAALLEAEKAAEAAKADAAKK